MTNRYFHNIIVAILLATVLLIVVPAGQPQAYAATKTPARVSVSSATVQKNTIKVKFKKVSRAKKYQVAYRKNGTSKWQKATVKKPTYTIKKLKYGTKYNIKVRAYNGKWGKWSKIKTRVTVPAKAVISSTSLHLNNITLVFEKTRSAKYYQIAYKENDSESWIKVKTFDTSYTIGKLIFGKKYNLKVRAYNGKWGSWSNIKTIAIPGKVLMTELSSTSNAPRNADVLTDNYDNAYSTAIINKNGYGQDGAFTYEYSTNALYDRFTGTLYIPKGEKSDDISALVVKGDGHILYRSPVLTKTSKPVDVDVDITGVSILTVEWVANSVYSNLSDLGCCLADPYLRYSNNIRTAINTASYPISLLELTSIYSTPRITDRFYDNYGNSYSSAIYNDVDNMHSNNIPVYEYLLDAKYSKLTGTLYVPKGLTFDSTVSMTIEADGSIIYTSPAMSRTSGPVDFDVDVSGCNDVKITFTESSWYDSTSDKTLCIAYPYLYE